LRRRYTSRVIDTHDRVSGAGSRKVLLGIGLLVLAVLALHILTSSRRPPPEATAPQTRTAPARPAPQPQRGEHRAIGFETHEKLVEHFRKHGAEFGGISREEYLRLAQELRDRPAGSGVVEFIRADRVVTRFDRAAGAFLAFNPDFTIRTFFKPNDGEGYFVRQSRRKPR